MDDKLTHWKNKKKLIIVIKKKKGVAFFTSRNRLLSTGKSGPGF